MSRNSFALDIPLNSNGCSNLTLQREQNSRCNVHNRLNRKTPAEQVHHRKNFYVYITRKMRAKRFISPRKIFQQVPSGKSGVRRRTCFRFLTMDGILSQLGEDVHGAGLNCYELICRIPRWPLCNRATAVSAAVPKPKFRSRRLQTLNDEELRVTVRHGHDGH
jgi:hypothetical protein